MIKFTMDNPCTYASRKAVEHVIPSDPQIVRQFIQTTSSEACILSSEVLCG